MIRQILVAVMSVVVWMSIAEAQQDMPASDCLDQCAMGAVACTQGCLAGLEICSARCVKYQKQYKANCRGISQRHCDNILQQCYANCPQDCGICGKNQQQCEANCRRNNPRPG